MRRDLGVVLLDVFVSYVDAIYILQELQLLVLYLIGEAPENPNDLRSVICKFNL
jgi:hypothetical protein